MNNPESVKIVNRFYEALDMLIASNVLRGIQTFTTTYGINKRNFYTAKKEPESNIFQMAWLTYLVRDFGVSAQWLMTGVGGMFGENKYPFSIDNSRLQVSMAKIQSLVGKMTEVTYTPSERQRKLTGKLNAIKFDKGPAIELINDKKKSYIISIYSITAIGEL